MSDEEDDGLDLTPEQRELARRIQAERGNVHPFPSKPRRRKPHVPPGGWPTWSDQLLRDDKGRVIAELANVLIALRADYRFAGAFAFDEMRQKSMVMANMRHIPEAKPGCPRETEDDDVLRLQEWLQFTGLPRIGRDTVGQALEVVAREHRFHPVQDYLDNLKWDEKPRVTSWIKTYLGAADQPEDYLAEIGQMFLVAMIARIRKPGCKADYMLVLEGGQGVEKSKACRALAGEWFGDCLPDIHSKDAKSYLAGKWLIEVSELAAFTKADIEPLKAFITRQEEDYRPPYGRHNVKQPRQCAFIGTTNRAAYIKDDTGARRFWPAKVGQIDVDAIERDRDQLFAEANLLHQIGALWWPTPAFEAKWIKPEQETRIESDVWWESIAEHLEKSNEKQFTVRDIAINVLGFEQAARISAMDSRRISNILMELGLEFKRTTKERFYLRPDVK